MKRFFALIALLCVCLYSWAWQIAPKPDTAWQFDRSAVMGALGALAGIVVGAVGSHRFSLSRDRRKEFNELADPLRVALKDEKQSINPNYSNLNKATASTLADILGGKRGAALDQAVERYIAARQQWTVRDDLGGISYSQTVHIKEAIDAILMHLARR